MRRKHEIDNINQLNIEAKKDLDEESLKNKEKSSLKLFGIFELNNYGTYQQFIICVSGVFILYLSHGFFQV